jgi:Zn-dependent protease
MNEVLFLVIPIIIISIIIHEVAHGWAALFLGDKTAQYAGRLTMNPLPHIDIIGSILLPVATAVSTGLVLGYAKPVPYNPDNLRPVNWLGKEWAEAIVAFSGPAVNFVLAILFALVIRACDLLNIVLDPLVAQALVIVVFINIFLGLLNLIPVPPLDGSKILFTFVGFRVRRFMEQYSVVLILVALFLVLSTPLLEWPAQFIVGVLL